MGINFGKHGILGLIVGLLLGFFLTILFGIIVILVIGLILYLMNKNDDYMSLLIFGVIGAIIGGVIYLLI